MTQRESRTFSTRTHIKRDFENGFFFMFTMMRCTGQLLPLLLGKFNSWTQQQTLTSRDSDSSRLNHFVTQQAVPYPVPEGRATRIRDADTFKDGQVVIADYWMAGSIARTIT